MAAGGDLIRDASDWQAGRPRGSEPIQIIQRSDIRFANMESNLVDYENYPSHFTRSPQTEDGAADVKTMGFDLLSRRYNHTTDAGPEVMF